MAFAESNMLPLGTQAPDFHLLDTVSGDVVGLNDLKSDKATVVMFICNHCPYVIHVQPEMLEVAHDYIPKGVAFIAISPNDVVNYPQDGPDRMKELAAELAFPFVYLYDESQDVARDYDAACTPDFYVFDGQMTLNYRGRLDDSRPGNGQPLNGKDLREALDRVLAGDPMLDIQYPSGGCNIKWK